jgi:hypothetical protein
MHGQLQYIRAVRVLVVAVLLAVGVASCGSDGGDYANKPRPPAPISVTAAIDANRVRVSPPRFGSGPVVFIVSNQSGAPQKLTFETDEIGGENGGTRRSTGTIESRSTGQLKVDPREGTYKLSASGGDITAATVEVGPRRRSSQNDLLLP